LLLGVFTRVGKKIGRVLGEPGGADGLVSEPASDELSARREVPNAVRGPGVVGGDQTPSVVEGGSVDDNDAEAEALCVAARAELQPFRRDALFRDVARLMVTAHSEGLRRYCASQVGEGADADDLAQRALLVLWEKLPGFEGRSRLRTFLYGIAANLCRQARRDEQRDAALIQKNFDAVLDGVHPDRQVAVDDELDLARRRRRVLEVIERLDKRDGWLIRHRLVEQADYHELLPLYRAKFGASITTVEGLRTAFFHAKGRLLRALEEADHER
jgi:RNA polymerase sigma factor (sigma-70 family)